MSSHHVLSETEVLRLPPMLFGSIRWPRGFGGPVGDPCSGFKIIVVFKVVHEPWRFRMG
jgi:hypothetical protein